MVSFILLLNRACLGVIGMPDTILNAKQVTQITGLSRTTIWRLERTEMFPKRLQISSSRVGWSKEEINAWMETLKAARPNSFDSSLDH